MAVLYELCVAVRGADDEPYLVEYELQERSPYPPTPRAKGTTVGLVDAVGILDEAVKTVPADVFAPAMLPALVDDLSWLWDRSRLETFSKQFARTMMAGQVEKALSHLFQGPGKDLLRRLLGLLPPAGTYASWETPEKVGRITLDLGDTALRRVPWELADWGGVGQQLTLLRRTPERAGQRSSSFDLPLTVAIEKCVDAIRFADGWGDDLFDGFTRYARDAGGIVWTEQPEGPEPGEVHHIVYDSGSGGSWDEMLSLLGSDDLRSGRRPPRLLVLHDVATRIPSYLTTRLIYKGLEMGADAVLSVSFDTLDPGTGGFFPIFYRKVMHNLPLDQCLLVALKEAKAAGPFPLDCAFGARKGGEFSLLLTRAVVETVQAVPVVKAADWSKASPTRQERIMASVQAQVQQAAETWREKMEAEVENLAAVTFDAEAHGVYEVVQNRARVRDAAAALARSAEAMGTLMSAGRAESHRVRMTNLWLTEGDAGQERSLTADEALLAMHPYALHLQIGTRVIDALVAAAFPEGLLREIFERQEEVELDVTFFSPETDFRLEQRRGTLRLPRVGDSNELRLALVPQTAGTCRLRACLYYRNVLLQSVLLEATVVEEGQAMPEHAGITAMMDYGASTDLELLDELPQPTLSLFTNQASDGSHWIGVFGADDPARGELRKGAVHTFGAGQLADRAKRLREVLAEVEGQDDYNYEELPPISNKKLQISENELKWREKDLIELAVAGWRLFDDLFWSYPSGLDEDQLLEFEDKLRVPGLISVARCRGESTTIPWAALYSLPLDTGRQAEMELCAEFKAQLQANDWSADGTDLVDKKDLLDDPEECRSQTHCPLADRQRERVTICPFGFWGIRHQVEQPLQQVTPTPLDQVPEELKDPAFNQSSFLMRAAGGKVRMAMGIDRDIPGAAEHSEEMPTLDPGNRLDVVCQEERDQVMALLEEGGYHFYYFYCHGEVDNGEFKLKLGPTASPGFIASADLHPRYIRWSDQQPFVVLNGCETMALTPELIHGFLEKLRRLGALGIVGTEIKVWTQLARPLGRTVVRHLLAGRSVGEAFLEARRHLLRQYNPLGLVYTLHAPATLHLHDPGEGACAWCRVHRSGVS
jgi:hypothetical protein